MTSIGELVVNLKVRSEVKKVEDFNKSLKNTASSMSKLRSGFATLNFASRLFQRTLGETIKQAKEFGQIEHFAKSVNASANALRESERASERLGVSGKAVEAALTRIEELNQAIRRGGTARTNAIEEYGRFGLEAVDSTGKAIDAQTQFNNILERTKELPVEVRRKFDKEFAGGQGLLNLTDSQLDDIRLTEPAVAIQRRNFEVSETNKALLELQDSTKRLNDEFSPLITISTKLANAMTEGLVSIFGVARKEDSFLRRTADNFFDPWFKFFDKNQKSIEEFDRNRVYDMSNRRPPPSFGGGLNFPSTNDLLKPLNSNSSNLTVHNNIDVDVNGGNGNAQTIGDTVEHKLNKVLANINRDFERMLYNNQERE